MIHHLRALRFAALGIVALLSGGCMNVAHTFEHHDAARVWNAMVTVAETPEYRDWHVLENHAWADDEAHRIEIHRVIHRQFYETAMKSRYERREWRFNVMLVAGDPPRAEFTSRGAGIPAHARIEADRYFEQVRRLLSGESMPEVESRRSEEITAPTED